VIERRRRLLQYSNRRHHSPELDPLSDFSGPFTAGTSLYLYKTNQKKKRKKERRRRRLPGNSQGSHLKKWTSGIKKTCLSFPLIFGLKKQLMSSSSVGLNLNPGSRFKDNTPITQTLSLSLFFFFLIQCGKKEMYIYIYIYYYYF
jgi:hypothetical protein